MSRLSISSSDLPAVDFEALKDFESKIDNAINDFKRNQNTSKSYQTIKNIQQEIDEFFTMNSHDTQEYVDLMTQICTKLNENPIIDSMIEQFQKQPSQSHSSTSNYISQPQLIDFDDEDIQIESFVQSQHTNYVDIDNMDALNLGRSHSSKSTQPRKVSQYANKQRVTPGAEANPQDDFKIQLEKANNYIKEIENLLQERKILAANRKVEKIETILNQFENQNLSREQKEQVTQFKDKNAKLIELIQDETELINYNLEVLQVEEGWITEKEKGKIKISYQYPDSSSMSLKMESELDVPLKNLLCLGNEFEYFKDYVPFVEEGKLVKEVRRATKIGYACMDVPMVSKRECYFYGTGFNLLDEIGSIPLISRTIHSDPEFCRKLDFEVPKKTKHVRLEYKYYVFNIIPLGPNKCYVKIVLNVDYKIPLVPKSIQNWCARKFALYLFEKIIKKATNFSGSNWEKAIQKSKDFYDWLDVQIEQFLKDCDLKDNSNTLEQAKQKINKYLLQKKQEQQYES